VKPHPCPWCGSGVVIAWDEAEDGSVTYHFVECETCGVQGPMCHSNGDPLTEAEAVQLWNEVAP